MYAPLLPQALQRLAGQQHVGPQHAAADQLVDQRNRLFVLVLIVQQRQKRRNRRTLQLPLCAQTLEQRARRRLELRIEQLAHNAQHLPSAFVFVCVCMYLYVFVCVCLSLVKHNYCQASPLSRRAWRLCASQAATLADRPKRQ